SSADNWEEVYRLLERAQTKKRNFTYPPIGTEKIVSLSAKTLFSSNIEELSTFHRFDLFGEDSSIMSTEPNEQVASCELGFAVASPLLFLNEGNREITLTLACQKEGFNEKLLKELIASSQTINLFEAYISGATQWLIPNKLKTRVGNFILGEAIAIYSSDY